MKWLSIHRGMDKWGIIQPHDEILFGNIIEWTSDGWPSRPEDIILKERSQTWENKKK